MYCKTLFNLQLLYFPVIFLGQTHQKKKHFAINSLIRKIKYVYI